MATITIGPDGPGRLLCEDGWRAAMVGTPGSPDKGGPRRHAIDTAATPESGKPTSFDRRDREIDRVRAVDPGAW